MVDMLERGVSESSEEQAASDGRFFEPINPWIMGKVYEFPAVAATARTVHQELDELPEELFEAWRKSPAQHPKLDRLIEIQNTYADDARLISGEGHRQAETALSKGLDIKVIGNSLYYATRIDDVVCLCTTDEFGEALIFLANNSDHMEGSRVATAEDYARFLTDINDEANKQAAP